MVTHRDTGRVGKALSAFAGLTRAAWLLGTRRVDLRLFADLLGILATPKSGRGNASSTCPATVRRPRPRLEFRRVLQAGRPLGAAARTEDPLERCPRDRRVTVMGGAPARPGPMSNDRDSEPGADPVPAAGPEFLAGPHRQPGPSCVRKGSRTIVRALAILSEHHRTLVSCSQVTAICRRSTTKHAGSESVTVSTCLAGSAGGAGAYAPNGERVHAPPHVTKASRSRYSRRWRTGFRRS